MSHSRSAIFTTGLFLMHAALAGAESPAEQDLSSLDWGSYSPEGGLERVAYDRVEGREPSATAFRISVPTGKPLDFYQYSLDLPEISPGDTLEFSCWIRTEGVTEGNGAWISIGGLDKPVGGERLMANDSERIYGNTDWVKVTAHIFVPDNIAGLRLLMLMNDTGTAWFDHPLLMCVGRSECAARKTIPIRVTNRPTIASSQFIGFGAEDDCFFFTEENYQHGVDEADIALREERIAEIDPKVISTLLWWDAFNPARDLETIDYDTDLMRAFYRSLEPHQAAGREVIVSDVFWGWTPEQIPYSDANLERGVRVYLDWIKHMVLAKGFTCIKTVSIAGEVDMRFVTEFKGSFDGYITCSRLLREGLDEAGLEHIKVVCDKVSGTVWFERAIRQGDPYFNLFTVHEYPDVTQFSLITQRLRDALEPIRRISKPVGKLGDRPLYKPAFVWEIGFRDTAAGDTDTRHSAIRRFDYGLMCANTCNAALNLGYAGGSVWCLQSMMYPGQNLMDYGFWGWKTENWPIRPFYYGYGLYSRFIENGATPYAVELDATYHDFSAAAIRNPGGQWLAYLVNLSTGPVTAVPDGLPDAAYAVYLYEESRIPARDAEGYGRISSMNTSRLWRPSEGPVEVPAKALILLQEQTP